MRLILQFFALTDRYERKARLLPGLLLAIAPALTAGTILTEISAWYAAVGAAFGFELLAAIVLGHYARARGRAVEESLWSSWGGPPTTRWLRPTDTTCSDQQKSKWRGAIRRVTGISVPASLPDGTGDNGVDQIIADASRQLRYVLRNKPQADLLRRHNEDYGFARNLYAVRSLWVSLAILCVVAAGVAIAGGIRAYVALLIALVAVAITMLVAYELPAYVRRCADRYAESLFATAMLPDAKDPAEQPVK